MFGDNPFPAALPGAGGHDWLSFMAEIAPEANEGEAANAQPDAVATEAVAAQPVAPPVLLLPPLVEQAQGVDMDPKAVAAQSIVPGCAQWIHKEWEPKSAKPTLRST